MAHLIGLSKIKTANSAQPRNSRKTLYLMRGWGLGMRLVCQCLVSINVAPNQKMTSWSRDLLFLQVYCCSVLHGMHNCPISQCTRRQFIQFSAVSTHQRWCSPLIKSAIQIRLEQHTTSTFLPYNIMLLHPPMHNPIFSAIHEGGRERTRLQ